VRNSSSSRRSSSSAAPQWRRDRRRRRRRALRRRADEDGAGLSRVDQQGGLASAVVPFALAGRPEQFQQIIDARVRPSPSVRVDALRAQPGDADGVVIITVLPSNLAPHMVADRYPARSGATTRYLSEREVEQLYARRSALRDLVAAERGLDDFVVPPDGQQQPPQGIGRMRLRVRPAMTVPHPDEPRLRDALERAHQHARDTVSAQLRADSLPASLDWLGQWCPRGASGWSAGQARTTDLTQPFENRLVAGTYIYGRGFSFQAVTGLLPPGLQTWLAYEHLWASETIGLLTHAGEFYRAVPAASPLRCDLELVGLANGLSFFMSHTGSSFRTDADVPRVMDSTYQRGDSFLARDLAADARPAARSLLDPLLASILPENVDIIDCISL
jgi:hypothetical protein